jgi:glutathione S-transferase
LLTLYDAPRCPFCARARIVLAEKGVDFETVIVELDERPAWIVDLNPPDGRVPVLKQDGLPLLPESRVAMRYLDEQFPEPPLMPVDTMERALVDLAFERFDVLISTPYYRLKNGRVSVEEFHVSLADFDEELGEAAYIVGADYTLADIAYIPWILRAERLLDVAVREHANIATWLERLEEREAIRAEISVVGSLVA